MALGLAVAVAGFAVLALEMLGTRLLGPYYGVSLYLWSALISVALLSLCAGYLMGGWLADRAPGRARGAVAFLLMGTAQWVAVIPWVKLPLIHLLEPLGMRPAVLLASLALFALPLTLLGAVVPAALKQTSGSLAELGRAAGRLSALSTVASLVGAVATGFYLLPTLGPNRLMSLVGWALLLAALPLASRRLWPALGMLGVLLALHPPGPGRDQGVVMLRHSPYGEIRVWERDNQRHLIIDGGAHTVIELPSGRSLYGYVNALELGRGMFERPGKALLLGLGGGSVVKMLAERGWSVDVAEIDPAIVETARDYFGLKDTQRRMWVGDARRFLRVTRQRYDFIVMDAFGSSYIPFHLVTREAFGEIDERLAPGGVLAIHLEAVGTRDPLLVGVVATLRQVFPHVEAVPASVFDNGLVNYILLCSHRPIEPDLGVEPPDPERGWWLERVRAWQQRPKLDLTDAPILTDDHNPVDLWAESLALAERDLLHRYYGPEGGSW